MALTVQLHVKLQPEDRLKLTRLALRRHLTLSEAIRRLIRDAKTPPLPVVR